MIPEGKSDLMSGAQQVRLTNRLGAVLEEFRTSERLSPFAILYFLIAYTWGYARACQWNTNSLKDFSARMYESCELAELKAKEPRVELF